MDALRLMRGVVIFLTGILIGVTFWQAAFGDEVGVVLVGLAMSVAGICIVTLTDSGP